MEEFDSNRKEIINEFFDSGFSSLVTITDPLEENSFEKTKEILNYHKNIYVMAAVHPHNADKYKPQIDKKIIDFAREFKAIGIGEAGLDFHYNFSQQHNQLKVFRRQIAIASQLKLPLVVHSRSAENKVLDTLRETEFKFPVIFHCYTGDKDSASRILEQGYYISISGIITFKKSEDLREIVKMIPLNKIFTETDSPYLSPAPFRGKINNPQRVKYVAQKIAEIKEIPVDELNQAVRNNFKKLFCY
jgi:TatD DNase family protein